MPELLVDFITSLDGYASAELRRANDILKAAVHFVGAELDRQSKK
jgi:hypothetical protein